jgi:hypothetical protein
VKISAEDYSPSFGPKSNKTPLTANLTPLVDNLAEAKSYIKKKHKTLFTNTQKNLPPQVAVVRPFYEQN